MSIGTRTGPPIGIHAESQTKRRKSVRQSFEIGRLLGLAFLHMLVYADADLIL
jgi:hypothetical protein